MSTTADDPPPFIVVPPERGDAPVVVHIPHSATALPADVRAQLLLTDGELSEELRRMTDHRTEQLAGDVGEHGASRFVNRWSRLAVDLHSYPRLPLPYELHATGPRPEVDIGTDPRHTPGWLRDLAVDAVTAVGLGHAENSPFAGTFVPTHHLGDPRVSSVMLEVRRDTYLDEATACAHDGEVRIRGLVTSVVERLATGRPTQVAADHRNRFPYRRAMSGRRAWHA